MHAPHLLRGLGIAVIVSAVLTLSACGISYDVTIHDDDTLDQTILIWDSGGVMGKSDCSAEGMGASGATAPAGADITYTFTDHNGDPACRISARGIPVSEFSGSNNSMSITHNDGKFDVTVPSGDASAKALYDDSDSSYSVTFPGKVIKASGNATIDGNTVTWNNYLEENGDLHAVGKDSPDRPWTWVAIGVAVVAVVGGSIVLTLALTTRGKRPPAQPGVPGLEYAQPAQPAPGAHGHVPPAQPDYGQFQTPAQPAAGYAGPWTPQPGGQGAPGYVQPGQPDYPQPGGQGAPGYVQPGPPDYPQPGGQGAPGYGPYGPYSNGQF